MANTTTQGTQAAKAGKTSTGMTIGATPSTTYGILDSTDIGASGNTITVTGGESSYTPIEVTPAGDTVISYSGGTIASTVSSLQGNGSATTTGKASTTVDPTAEANLTKIYSTDQNLNKGRLTYIVSQNTSESARTATTATEATSDQDKCRSYFVLRGNNVTGLINSAPNGIRGIGTALQGKYTGFLLTNVQLGFQEKQSIMPTIGDLFAATFSGKEPQLITLQGILPWDYRSSSVGESGTSSTNTNNSSWFINMINAYNYFFRASILAKFKCYLEIMMPGLKAMNAYPVAFNTNINADNDHIIPFTMSAYIMDPNDGVTVYGASASTATSTGSAAQTAAAISSTGESQTFAQQLASGSVSSDDILAVSGDATTKAMEGMSDMSLYGVCNATTAAVTKNSTKNILTSLAGALTNANTALKTAAGTTTGRSLLTGLAALNSYKTAGATTSKIQAMIAGINGVRKTISSK